MGSPKLGMRQLESLVMNILWDSSEPLSSSQVRAALAHDRELAYTTVMTVLVRLWQKQLLTRQLKGRAYVYRPVRSREEDATQKIEAILAQVADRSGALASFFETLAPQDRAELLKLLKKRD